MKLKEWLSKNNVTLTDFCKAIDYTRIHICAYINERANISETTAIAIYQETMGECTVEELLACNPLKTNPDYKKKRRK